MHVLFLLQFTIFRYCSSFSYCSGIKCYCPSRLNLWNITCVPLCPTGYLQSEQTCTRDQSTDLQLFSLSFLKYWDFSVKVIGKFSLIPFGVNSTNPVFTKDRGFYFKGINSIQSNHNWVLSPQHTLSFVFKAVKDGIIFEVLDDLKYYLRIYSQEWFLCFSIVLTEIDGTKSYTEEGFYLDATDKTCLNLTYNQWFIVSFVTTQEIDQFKIRSSAKSQELETSTFIVKNKDFLSQKSGLTYKIGDNSEGFQGFLYEIILDNQQVIKSLRFYEFIDCEFGEFFDYITEKCTLCSDSYEDLLILLNKTQSSEPGSQTENSKNNSTNNSTNVEILTLSELVAENFTDIALCTREKEYCYSTQCSACSGFIFGTCSACFVNSTHPSCDFDFFSRKNCSEPLVLVESKSICGYPSSLSSSNLSLGYLVMNLGQFEGNISGLFGSGSKKSTFAPFNNPENDDPFPVKKRGHYFNGVSFLESTQLFSLNIEFTLSFWTFSTSKLTFNSSLWSSQFLNIRQDGVGRFCFFDGVSVYCEYSSTECAGSSGWVFTSFTSEFDQVSRTSSVTRMRNHLKENVLSVQQHVFLNRPSIVWLGRGEANFTGFIYQVGIWDYPANVSSVYYQFCIGTGIGCAYQAEKDYFFNNLTTSFQRCDYRCDSGCVEWGRCGPCLEADCSSCSDFESLCNDTRKNTCLDDLQLTQNKHCCHLTCKECKGVHVYDCIQCPEAKVMADGGCFDSCPIGYTLNGVLCTGSASKVMDVTFDRLSTNFQDKLNQITFGIIESAFNNFSATQPIPVVKRGLFFNESRTIISSKFLLPFNFMVTFFIKILKPGCIFEKGAMSLNSTSSSFIITINSKSFEFNFTIEQKWSKVVVGYMTTFNDTNSIFLNLNGLSIAQHLEKIWLLESLSEVFLGKNKAFHGFIYRMMIYSSSNYSLNTDVLPLTCSFSKQTQCLSPCQIDEYLNITSCSKCGNCPYGCYTDSHCNPCMSDHCRNCTDFNEPCIECDKNYILYKGKCGCQANFYLNKTTCYPCDYNCFDCEGTAKTCIDCGAFSEVVNSSCKCFKGFIEDTSRTFISYTCRCQDNSKLDKTTNTSCICDPGYVKVNDLCSKCNDRCLTCKGTESYECLTCKAILDNGICRDNCSLGFKLSGNQCEREKMPQGVFKLKFDQLQLPHNDQISSVGVEYGGKGRQLAESPSSILSRGLLFDGESNFLKFPSPLSNMSLLGSEFSFSIWFYPFKTSDILLTQSLEIIQSISVRFIDQRLFISIRLGSMVYSLISKLDVTINQWNNLIFGVKFSIFTSSFVMLNEKQDELQNISEIPFEEPISSVMTIGNNLNEYFKGFLYSFTIYNEIPALNTFKTEANLCGVSNSSSCLSSCNISFFYDNKSKECFPCMKECATSCRNNISCSQCLDPKCKICESFQSNCTECYFGFELTSEGCLPCGSELFFDTRDKKCKFCEVGTFIVDGKCIRCASEQFFDKELKKCVDCSKLCSDCEGLNNCTACIPKAFMKEDGFCYCEKGYDPDNRCSYIQSYFTVRAFASLNNEVNLIFSEDLVTSLNKSSLNVTVNQFTSNYSLSVISNSQYLLVLELPEVVRAKTVVQIKILDFLKSVNNSLLRNNSTQATLFANEASDMAALITEAKAMAKTGVSAGLSAALGTSALSFDPVSFFSFLSTAEIYYPISLFNCDLPEDLLVFLGSLRAQSMMPNLIAYGIQNSGSEIPQKFRRIGFTSNLFLVNTGVNLTLGIIFLVIMGCINLMSFNQTLKPYLKKIKKMFEYGIFLKFWVQSFLELLLGAIITLKFNSFSSALERFDFFVGLVILVRNIQIIQLAGIFLLISLIFRRTRVDEESMENFIISFGVIFDEFKSYGLSFWIFYLIYVMRRLFCVFIAVFVEEGMIQAMVCFCFSLLLFIYVLATQCFKNPVSNIYVIVNEALAFITSVVLILNLIGRNFSRDDANKLIRRLVIAAWALNIAYGIAVFAYNFSMKVFFKKKNAKVVDVNSLTVFENHTTSKLETNNENSITVTGCYNLPVIEVKLDAVSSVPFDGSFSPDIMIVDDEFPKIQHFPSPADSFRSN